MGAAAGSGLLESVPFVGKGLDMFESVWQVADGFVSTVLGLLLIAGAVLAYLLPALPFIRFLFAILGWIVTVAVAVLAVTVFAAAHVTRGDGNRLATQATRLGWLFLPGLILRPPLMLFGLITLAISCSWPGSASSTRSGCRRCATRAPPAGSAPLASSPCSRST